MREIDFCDFPIDPLPMGIGESESQQGVNPQTIQQNLQIGILSLLFCKLIEVESHK